jgi:hypothetical protein
MMVATHCLQLLQSAVVMHLASSDHLFISLLTSQQRTSRVAQREARSTELQVNYHYAAKKSSPSASCSAEFRARGEEPCGTIPALDRKEHHESMTPWRVNVRQTAAETRKTYEIGREERRESRWVNCGS